jgi:hypothetical protein
MEAPDGTKLNSVAFGGYSEPAPCRTYDQEADGWLNGEVLYAKDATCGEPYLDRMEAARLRIDDSVFIARGNTAAAISEEELSTCQRGIQEDQGAKHFPVSMHFFTPSEDSSSYKDRPL